MTGATLLRRIPAPALRPFVSSIVGYEEHGEATLAREPASLDVPVVLTLAGGFHIALDRQPGAPDRVTSFAAGLHAGFVAIGSDGAAACVQVNLTPLGARLALGLPMRELAGRMVGLDDLPGTGLGELADRLAACRGWEGRLAVAEAWAAARSSDGAPDPGVSAAFRMLSRSGGTARVAAVADRLGWSRKRLAARFQDDIGVPPKTLARILRFRRAERMARASRPDWADIAAACGYSDQSHLVREFRALAGVSPTAWAAGRG